MYIKTFALMIVSAVMFSHAVKAECACSKNRAPNAFIHTDAEPSIEDTLDLRSPS